MKRTLKKPAIVFLVLSVVFFVAWAVMLCASCGLFANPGQVLDGLKTHWNALASIFTFQGNWYADWRVYGVLGVCLISLVLIVVGIVVAAKRNRARLSWYAIMIVLITFPVLDLIVGFEAYWQFLTQLPQWFGSDLAGAIYLLCVIICAILAYVFMWLTYCFGLVWAKRRLEAFAAPVEEIAQIEEAPVVEEAPVEAPVATEDVNEEAFAIPAVNEEEVAVEPVVEEKNEPMADFVAEPAQINAQPEEIIVEEIPLEKENEANAPVTKDELSSILKDIVRDIVRDEIARSGARDDDRPSKRDCGSITGASFGGPLVVQYFNGGIQGAEGVSPAQPNITVNSAVPAPAPAPVAPAPAPAPAAAPAPKANNRFQKKEPAPEAPAPVVAPVVVPVSVVPAPAPVAEEEKKKIVRIPFQERLFAAEKDMKDNYNELKSEFLSWGLHSRVSNSGDTFRLHTKTYAKLTVAGKSLKIYFALDPKEYADSTIPFQDASEKGLYVDIPFVFKVKSGLSLKRAKALIKECCEKDGLTQGAVEANDWIKELKAELKGTKSK